MSIIDHVIELADKANPKKAGPFASGGLISAAELVDKVFHRTDEQKALHAYVRSLPDECMLDLITAMYCGRENESWAFMRRHIASTIAPEHRASQLLGKAPLADYLRNGKRRVPKSSPIRGDQ